LHCQIGEYPRTGAATSSKLSRYLDHHADRHFITAVARGLKQPIKAGVLEILVSLAWNEAIALRRKRLFAQRCKHGPGSVENCFSVCCTRYRSELRWHMHTSRDPRKKKRLLWPSGASR